MYDASYVRDPNDDRYSGVRLLLMKVIVRAMFDLASYKDHPKPDERKKAEDARRWMFDKNKNDTGFESICLVLGLNPRKIRERASTMTKEDVAKIEFKDRRPVSDSKQEYKEQL